MVEGNTTLALNLKPSGTHTFNLGFCPVGEEEARMYAARLQLFVGDDPTENAAATPYLDIAVKGMGSNASIFFDRREVILPLVPVGVTAKTTMYLLNHGFDNVHVKCLFPEGLGFEFAFPEGQILSVAKKRLPVEVSFTVKKPTAASGTLSFVDSHGREYSISVCGVSDVSHWTVHPFYKVNAGNLSLSGGPGRPLAVRLLEPNAKIDWYQLLSDGAYPVSRPTNLSVSHGEGRLAADEQARAVAMLPLLAESMLLANSRDLELIIVWANAALFPKTVESFQALIDTQGKILFEMVDALDKGKKQGNEKKKKREALPILPQRPKESEVVDLLGQYQELLDLVKVAGGLTTNVITAHMLPYAGLCKLYFSNDSQSMGPFSLKTFYDEHHAVLQKAAWASVLYQIVRILALNRVTPRFYEACVSAAAAHPQSLLRGLVRGGGGGDRGGLNSAGTMEGRGLNSARSARSAVSGKSGAGGGGGMSPRGSQAGGGSVAGGSEAGGSEARGRQRSSSEKGHVAAGSNLYSPPETLLLKWLTLHTNCVRRDSPVFLRDFSADLCDSRVLAAVIISHIPCKKATLDRLEAVAEGDLEDQVLFEARLVNAKKLLAVLHGLQMPFLPPPEEIAGGNARVLVLLALTLMDVCPQLIPRGDIDFTGRLNTPVVREIALNNPIGRSITYLIKLEGSDEFTCEHKYLVIPPKSSAPLPVIHKAKFTQPTTSTLFLLPSEAQDRISPLVFSLASTVMSNQPSGMLVLVGLFCLIIGLF